MMRRAGMPPENMAGPISKSYCTAHCLEGQFSIDLVPVLPAPAPDFERRISETSPRSNPRSHGVIGPNADFVNA
jgi:hypothetical protein